MLAFVLGSKHSIAWSDFFPIRFALCPSVYPRIFQPFFMEIAPYASHAVTTRFTPANNTFTPIIVPIATIVTAGFIMLQRPTSVSTIPLTSTIPNGDPESERPMLS